ncbi:hypothetical protein [Zoogloea sp.]|uniref:hypothetical protein n=1 Tax=Zoogloea sp. TaxID=49181 RepID=UPI00262DAAB4|nr:hypothetical protein [Zoogloea sp.]
MSSSPLRLLLIDDNAEFTKTVEIYAAMQGWQVEIGRNVSDWQPSGDDLDIVLLDFGLHGGSFRALEAWAETLHAAKLLSVTWLLSGSSGLDRHEFVEHWGLRGYLRKPIDLSQIPKLAEQSEGTPVSSLSEVGESSFPLDQLAKRLDPAIDIIDLASLDVVWSNHGEDNPLTRHDRKLLRLLEEELCSPDGGSRSPQRLDWDAEKEVFRYTRLYPVGEYYWLIRDWREEETIHDADLFDLEAMPDFNSRLRSASLYLAKRHGITRLRIYKVADLPSSPALESIPPSPLVMPLFERGGGFKPDAAHWMQTGFLLDDNPEARKVSDPAYVCTPEPVTDVVKHEGCNNIEFGDAGTRAQFPVHLDGKLRVLLDFDRRWDHLKSLNAEDKELAEVALRIAGVFDGPLVREEVDAMKGLLQDLGTRLLGWLREGDEECRRAWLNRISEALQDSLIEQPRARDAEPFEALSSICTRLLEQWGDPAIAGGVWGLLPKEEACAPDPRPQPLSGWYLALAQGDEQWLAVAGGGLIYRKYKEHGSPLPMLPPHRQAFSDEFWQAQAIQDFQAWLARGNASRLGALPKPYHFLSEEVKGIGSWLAVPMPLEDSGRALMVVHSPYRFHFTELRCQLMSDAARRLLPPLAAAVQQSKLRGAFTAAVMHEVKTDAAAALLHCEALEEHWRTHPELVNAETTQRLNMLRHYLEGLSELGRDFLDVLRPDGRASTRFQEDLDYELGQSQQVIASDWLENLLRPWRWLYGERRQVSVIDTIGERLLQLPAPMMLRRVARVLLQNAFRHGKDEIVLKLALADEGSYMQLTITNCAYADVAAGTQVGTRAVTAQIGPVPQARARVGLANAIRLTQAVKGTLRIEHEPFVGKSEDDLVQVKAELCWPLAVQQV